MIEWDREEGEREGEGSEGIETGREVAADGLLHSPQHTYRGQTVCVTARVCMYAVTEEHGCE